MQINIDKKTGTFLAVITLLLAVIISLVINRDGGHNSNGMQKDSGANHMGMGHNGSMSESASDIMFLQMMIPHHQQAVDISNLALKTSKNPELLALAKKIIASQSSEIIQMNIWLKEAGTSTDMGHSMDGMGGMLDQSDLSALAAATGKSFDLLWLNGMIGHHDGALDMTRMIEGSENPELKTFGQKIVKVQSAEITAMKALVERLS